MLSFKVNKDLLQFGIGLIFYATLFNAYVTLNSSSKNLYNLAYILYLCYKL